MLDTAARIALSPLLIAQAVSVRRRAQSLPEAAGPRTGTLGDGPPLSLLIIGDSSAAGVGAEQQSNALAGQLARQLSDRFTVNWRLNALIGATTRSTISRLEAEQAAPIDVVITALGVNDVTRLVSPRSWLHQQKNLLARIGTLYNPQHIYLSGMPPLEHFPLLPNPLRWTLARHGRALHNRMTGYAASQDAITYVPFAVAPRPELVAPDGFHPSEDFYELWAQQLASRIVADRHPDHAKK